MDIFFSGCFQWSSFCTDLCRCLLFNMGCVCRLLSQRKTSQWVKGSPAFQSRRRGGGSTTCHFHSRETGKVVKVSAHQHGPPWGSAKRHSFPRVAKQLLSNIGWFVMRFDGTPLKLPNSLTRLVTQTLDFHPFFHGLEWPHWTETERKRLLIVWLWFLKGFIQVFIQKYKIWITLGVFVWVAF